MSDTLKYNDKDEKYIEEEGTKEEEGTEEEETIEAQFVRLKKKLELERIGKNFSWKSSFTEMYNEILTIESEYTQSKIEYTDDLLKNGSHENPQDVYNQFDMVLIRLEKVHIVKRMCLLLGLTSEMDNILDREMNLIYNSKTRTPSTPNLVVGAPKQ